MLSINSGMCSVALMHYNIEVMQKQYRSNVQVQAQVEVQVEWEEGARS